MESYGSFLDRDAKYIKNILKLLYRFTRTPAIGEKDDSKTYVGVLKLHLQHSEIEGVLIS